MDRRQVEALSTQVVVTFSSGRVMAWELSLRPLQTKHAMVQMRFIENNEYQPAVVELCSQALKGDEGIVYSTGIVSDHRFNLNLCNIFKHEIN